MFAGGPLTVYREYSPTGAVGIPEVATAETGERLFAYLGREVTDIVSGMHERRR